MTRQAMRENAQGTSRIAGTRRAAWFRAMRGRIANYQLGDEIGAGGMGRVFAAIARDGSALAVKCLHPTFAGNAVLRERLLEEARLARLVVHPNVVCVIDVGSADDGVPFLVMQRCGGTPLGARIRDGGPLPLQRIRIVATQILAGLAAIHAAGIVHGDLKSDNILVDDRDRVTIIDFGLARAQHTTPSWLGEDMLSGTPEYMAPEAIRGEPMTVAADLYAVGIILYEMLTGTTPFGGGGTTDVFLRHLEDEVVLPSLRCSERELPTALEAVVMRALAKNPARRHHDARMFETALDRAIPRDWVDVPVAGVIAFSTTASTRPCGLTPHAPARRRLARGTRRR